MPDLNTTNAFKITLKWDIRGGISLGLDHWTESNLILRGSHLCLRTAKCCALYPDCSVTCRNEPIESIKELQALSVTAWSQGGGERCELQLQGLGCRPKGDF